MTESFNLNLNPRTYEEKYEGDLELSTILFNRLNDLKKEIKVMLPCKVTKVNHDGNYVTVEILDYDSDEIGNAQEFPPLTNVPIRQCMDSGSAYIRLPVQIGDIGTIEFFDSSVDDLVTSNVHTYDLTEDWHKLSDNLFTNGFLPKDKLFVYSIKNTDLIKKENNPTMLAEPTAEVWDREQVLNEDGSYSTALSITVEIDDNLIVIPTCYGGSIHTSEESVQHYLSTGEHFGIFNNSNESAVETYTVNLHNAQSTYTNSSGPITIGFKNNTFILTVDNVGNLVISAPNISLNATTTINMAAPNINITGITNITGATNITGETNITGATIVTGEVTGAGVDLSAHTHPYTDDGVSMNTSAPN